MLVSGATLTVTDTRYVFSTAPVNGTYDLGINVNDVQTVLHGGVYQAGTHSASANLDVVFDGLEFSFTSMTAQFFTIGSSKFQNFDFLGQMLAGTNSLTGQQYSSAPADLGHRPPRVG